MPKEMVDLQYDEMSGSISTGWWLSIDGKDYFFAQSVCTLNEDENTISVPLWIVEKNGLEGYIV